MSQQMNEGDVSNFQFVLQDMDQEGKRRSDKSIQMRRFHSENRAVSATTSTVSKLQGHNSATGSPYGLGKQAATIKTQAYNGKAKANGAQGGVTRPYSTYSSQAATLKRIKSELETIQERKEDREINDNHDWANDGNQGPIMENILLDESYSFSLRQFEKQASKRDLQQLSVENAYFDQSRASNMSAYAQNLGDTSNRANAAQNQHPLAHSNPATDQRRSSSKVLSLLASHEFRPFSKPRNNSKNNQDVDRQAGSLSKRSNNNMMHTATI